MWFFPLFLLVQVGFVHFAHKIMQKKESQFEALGICHRTFNLIMKSLFPRSLKSVTLGSSGCDVGSPPKPKDDADLGYEIPVLFKQSEEQVNDVSNGTSSVHRGSSQEVKLRGPNKVGNLKLGNAAEEQEKAKEKGMEPAPVVRVPPRHWSVGSNINEKSDAFIKSKRDSMKRNQLGA